MPIRISRSLSNFAANSGRPDAFRVDATSSNVCRCRSIGSTWNANGIGAGFISYVLLRSVTGRAREIHLLMWIVAAAFVVYFAIGPIQAAIG